MKLDVKIQLLRFFSQVFNTVFLVLGLSVAGCALWILFDRGSLLTALSSTELQTVGVGLLVIGGVVLLVGVVGCVGANGENRFLLLTYLGFLIVLVLGQLFVTLLLLLNRNKISQSLEQTVSEMIVKYGGNRHDRLMDNIQKYGKCCGRMGPADWLENSYIQNQADPDQILPCSCFVLYRRNESSPWCSELNTNPPHGQGNSSHTVGCKEEITNWLKENGLTIVGMAGCLILIEVVQFVIAVYLYQTFGEKAALKRNVPLVDSDEAQLDFSVPEDYVDNAAQNYGYVDPDGGFIDPDGGFIDPDGGFIDPDGGFIDPDGGFIDPDGGFIDPDGGFIDPDGGFIDPDGGFIDPDGGFIDPAYGGYDYNEHNHQNPGPPGLLQPEPQLIYKQDFKSIPF